MPDSLAVPTLLLATASQPAFTLIDWLVVVASIVVVLGVGLWTSRGQGSTRDYFLGGRNLPWWLVGLSIVATETSALTFIGVPAMAFGALTLHDDGTFTVRAGTMYFLMIVLGHLIGRAIIAWWIVPKYFEGEVYTTNQLLVKAFGVRTRMAVAAVSLLGMTLGAGVRVFVTAIPIMVVMKIYFPWWGITPSIALIMVAAMVYTWKGGIKAVVWTDMVQYFLFVFGGLAALAWIVGSLQGAHAAPSGATGWKALTEGGADNLLWFNLGFAAQGGLGAHLRELLTGPFNLWMGLLATPVGIVFALGFDQLNVQRILACPNAREGRRAMVLSALLIAPQFLLFLLIGVGLFAFYKATDFQFGAIPPITPGTDRATADFVFPIFIVNHMPEGLRGFLIAAILAAAMSSVSSALSAMSSIMVMDFFRPWSTRHGAEPNAEREMQLSKLGVLAAGVALTGVAYLSQAATFVFTLAFQLAGLTAGALLGAFLYAFWFGRGSTAAACYGIALSVGAMVGLNIVMARTGFNIAWPWHASIGTLVCLVGIAMWHAAWPPPNAPTPESPAR